MLGMYQDKIANFLGEAYVGEKRKCEVRFSVAVMDKKEMEAGLKKLDFYVCGILMHRIIDGE
jgi:hypothetical protein